MPDLGLGRENIFPWFLLPRFSAQWSIATVIIAIINIYVIELDQFNEPWAYLESIEARSAQKRCWRFELRKWKAFRL